MEHIAFDAHKRYTQVSVETVDGQRRYEGRIVHARAPCSSFSRAANAARRWRLRPSGPGTWIVDEIEAAGQVPQLVHARKAKLMLGMVNKTDKLDARGLNRLQRTGTLPTVWIPPGALRDQRDLPRTRMVLTRERTRLKNRIHATWPRPGSGLRVPPTCSGAGPPVAPSGAPPPPAAPPGRDGVSPRATRGRDRPAPRLRAPAAHGVCANAGTPVPPHVARGRVGAGRGHLARDRGHRPLPERRAPGRLCRHHAPGTRQRGPQPLRPAPGGRQPLPHVGLHRSGEYHLSPSPDPAAPARQSSLCAHPAAEGPPKAVGAVARHRAEASYWILTKREPDPRTRGTPGVVHGGTSARHAMSARRSALECDVPPGHHPAAMTAKIWLR